MKTKIKITKNIKNHNCKQKNQIIMNKQVVKFLEFKGKNIVYLSVNGTYWIAIKPVCEVLNVEYKRQYKNLKNDTILASELAKQPMQILGDDQIREYICLPEEFIYGWIFSIRSESKDLEQYKRECSRELSRRNTPPPPNEFL